MLEALLAKGLEEEPVFAETEDQMTLGELWTTIAQTPENLEIDKAIAGLCRQLMSELNLEASDFVMVPALFQDGMAVIPNAVNSVVVNGHLLVPKPLGPQLDEEDGFEQEILRKPSQAAMCGWFSSIHGTHTTRPVAKSIAARTPFAASATRCGGRDKGQCMAQGGETGTGRRNGDAAEWH